MKYKVLKKIALVNECNYMGNGNQVTPDLLILFQNKDVFEFTHNPFEADIIPLQINSPDQFGVSERGYNWCVDNFDTNKIGVVLNGIGHISEITAINTMDICQLNLPFEKLCVLHTDFNFESTYSQQYPQAVYVDHLWNRQYAMFFDNEDLQQEWQNLNQNHWYSSLDHKYLDTELWELTPDEQIIPHLDWYEEEQSRVKELQRMIYVCPGITRNTTGNIEERGMLRKELHQLLYNYPGYQGDISLGAPLLPQRTKYTKEDMLGIRGWGFSPIHNVYYDSSVVSPYVETLTRTNPHGTMCVTEKTWNAILKGHFILPYAVSNFIKHLNVNYGLEFPDWIDYTYDIVEESDVLRWQLYCKEVKRICDLGADDLYQKKRRDIDILLHNRNVMKNIGYRSNLDEKF